MPSFEHFMASFYGLQKERTLKTAVNFLYVITWIKLGKVLEKLALFSVEKVHALHLTAFLLSVLL